MNDSNLLQTLGQVSAGSAGEVLRDHLRGMVRQMITDVIAEEVTELCGPKHQPTGGDFYRAGTAPGSVIHDGGRESIVRPRVRQINDDGRSQEVTLATYEAARCPELLRDSITRALIAGVSTRDIATTQKKEAPGLSKSNVSRHWQSVGHQFVDQLRGNTLHRNLLSTNAIENSFLNTRRKIGRVTRSLAA